MSEALRQILLDPQVWGVILVSAAYGILMGAVPGLTATMAVALIVPLTYFMGPLHAMAAVVTLEACAIFAGDIPSALVRMPGTPSSAAYTDDMYAHGRSGRARAVLGRSLLLSVAGGLFGAAMLIGFARPLARVATAFTVIEEFWFYVLGLGCAVVVSRGSVLRGLFGLIVGLLLSTVGLSPVHTEERFTLGIPELLKGIDFIPAMIGLFGLSEVLRNVVSGGGEAAVAEGGGGKVLHWGDLLARPVATVRSSSIGALIGMLPGAGADIAAWVSYGVSRRFSKNPDEYGKGSLEGISDATAANNAALAGAWVPTLVFGIPGDSITALVIGILMMKNLRPGPEIFERQATLVYGIYIVFILANLILVPVGYLAIRAGSHLIRVPRRILIPVILFFCVLGAYSINGSGFDVGVMLVMGLLGFALERLRIPLGPVVLGLVLGGPLEERFVQSMTISQGSPAVFVSRPIAAGLGALCLLLWLYPALSRLLRRPKSS